MYTSISKLIYNRGQNGLGQNRTLAIIHHNLVKIR